MPILYSIPDIYTDGFKDLADMSEPGFSKVKTNISKAPLVNSIESLVDFMYSSIEEAKSLKIDSVFDSVGSLIAHINKKEIIKEILEDMVELVQSYGLVKAKDKKKFQKRLSLLINNEQIYYAAKADRLINKYGNVYINSRVLSDIRPVFDIEVESNVKAAVILHNLNIHYQSNEEPYHKDITLVLTLQDIRSLKEVLSRAEKKDEGLKNMLEKSTIKNLNENGN